MRPGWKVRHPWAVSAADPPEARTSELLRTMFADIAEAEVSVGWLLERMNHRAFGFALILFSLPSAIPMPPGIPTVCGLLLCIVASQMILGMHPLRLPRVLARRRFARADIERMVDRAAPWIERLERLARPRLTPMTGPVGYRLVGVVVLVLSVIVALPIPFLGNMPPAVATLIIGLGLTERDGLIVLVGMAASVIALIVSGTLAVEAAHWLIRWLTG